MAADGTRGERTQQAARHQLVARLSSNARPELATAASSGGQATTIN
jgi:hypothetical protein